MMNIGIDQISFYVPNYYIDLAVLAEKHGIASEKYYQGIGQQQMSMPAHDEDIVTLAACAAHPIIARVGSENIDTIMLATETGIDQSKSAAVYVHRLLGLSPNCRAVELKQACYSGTAALQMACALVQRHPQQKVLVITADISRYDLNSNAEATQGCGAVAMLISSAARIATIDENYGVYSEDVMDFWRPNYRHTALVDGKFSTQMYLKSLEKAWINYRERGGAAFTDFAHFCYHLPFAKMGVKAHRHLARINNQKVQAKDFEDAMNYNRIIGNSYSAALYLGLVSLLERRDDLDARKIALFSYGSGCVAEFFSATVCRDYRRHLYGDYHRDLLAKRRALTYQQYLDFWHYPDPKDGSCVEIDKISAAPYRLAKIAAHQRHYVAN